MYLNEGADFEAPRRVPGAGVREPRVFACTGFDAGSTRDLGAGPDASAAAGPGPGAR